MDVTSITSQFTHSDSIRSQINEKVEQLKAGLGKGSSFELRWEACNTYKSDNKTDKELTWRVVSERYNTT